MIRKWISMKESFNLHCQVHDEDDYGAGTRSNAAQVAEHLPKATLHAIIAGAVATPAVTVPKTAPAAE